MKVYRFFSPSGSHPVTYGGAYPSKLLQFLRSNSRIEIKTSSFRYIVFGMKSFSSDLSPIDKVIYHKDLITDTF